MGVRVKAHFVAIELRGIVQPDGAFNPEARHQDHKLVRVCGEHVRLRIAYSTRLAVGILCEHSLNLNDKRAFESKFESKEIVWKIARTEEVFMNLRTHSHIQAQAHYSSHSSNTLPIFFLCSYLFVHGWVVLEVQLRVELHRRPARQLGRPVPTVHVFRQIVQTSLVLELGWQRPYANGCRQQAMHHHVSVPF